jgi:hypothetical protein
MFCVVFTSILHVFQCVLHLLSTPQRFSTIGPRELPVLMAPMGPPRPEPPDPDLGAICFHPKTTIPKYTLGPDPEPIWSITIRGLYARWLWIMGRSLDQVWPHLQIIQIVLSSQWIPLSLRWISICSFNELASEQYNSYWYSQNTVDFTIN